MMIATEEVYVFPTSFAQQRLWFLEQLEPGSHHYHISRAMRLSGALDVHILQQALNTIVERHESLRTTFIAEQGIPTQVVWPQRSVDLPMIELGEFPSAEQELEVQRLIRLEIQKPFMLSSDLMLRALLLRLDREEHVLLLVMHHIASDGWSMGVLWRELSALYSTLYTGQSSSLPELPIQYADFTMWQRDWLQGEVLQDQLAYWKKQLEQLPALQLPTDRPHPVKQTFKGAHHVFVIPNMLLRAIKGLSRREGATLFMTLLAAFQTLLSRYTGQDDLAIGSPIANRNQAEIEGLIGFFVNMLVLRADMAGNPSFREFLARVREVTLEAHEHQDLPFEKIVEELQPAREPSQNPLFQVTFALQNAPPSSLGLSGLIVTDQQCDVFTVRFDLEFHLWEAAEGLSVHILYNTDLFDAATIERMAGHFHTLLAGIAADPDQLLSSLPMLTRDEQRQLLVEWNDTSTEYPHEKCIHQLFEEQVERTPDAVAVVDAEQQLTYRELNTKANQLASILRRSGVGPEIRVGLYVERSLTMIVGILGILKAGGGYIPIALSSPPKRITRILEDCQAHLLVTQHQLMKTLSISGIHILYLDNAWSSITQENVENSVSLTIADNMSYMIYTSGSTGSPKGTVITHDNVVRLFQATTSWFQFDKQDVWTLFHSYAFDFSVWELWGALFHGGRLVIVPYRVSRNPEAFYDLLYQEQVTVLNQTPSAFYQLIRLEEQCASLKNLTLRFVIFGGEALEFQRLNPWFEKRRDVFPQLINMYGITETTVHVTYHPLTRDHVHDTLESVVGRPLPDLQVYILAQDLQPVPVGAPGELHISGAGLARGYVNQSDVTAEKFIPNPFLEQSGKRLYKTGDLARYLPDGNIEFLGRIDQQVKIRGFRIELGEIEAVLGQHPAVREVVVLAREDVSHDKRLVAYVVFLQKSSSTTDNLRQFLRQKTPEYMIPSAFVFLEEFPLTPNGKIDRKALPEPEYTRPELEEQFIPPRTPVEEELARIWCDVLQIDQIGIHDNFFALGGHSLLATQVISRIAKIFRVSIPLRLLFETPTVAGLAFTVTQNLAEQLVPEGIEQVLTVLAGETRQEEEEHDEE